MENIRNGNSSVSNMKFEIIQSLTVLRNKPMHKRSMRQLADGDRFLKMIMTQPYYSCRTVSELKKKISEDRDKLKKILEDTDKYTDNYQISLFETCEEIDEARREKIQAVRKRIENEIHWLHKCLGICSNKDYFN